MQHLYACKRVYKVKKPQVLLKHMVWSGASSITYVCHYVTGVI